MQRAIAASIWSARPTFASLHPRPVGSATAEATCASRGVALVAELAFDDHRAVSLWLHEGRSVVEVASWLGHSPAMSLSTYAHVVDELREAPRVEAEEAIRSARVPAEYPRSALEG